MQNPGAPVKGHAMATHLRTWTQHTVTATRATHALPSVQVESALSIRWPQQSLVGQQNGMLQSQFTTHPHMKRFLSFPAIENRPVEDLPLASQSSSLSFRHTVPAHQSLECCRVLR